MGVVGVYTLYIVWIGAAPKFLFKRSIRNINFNTIGNNINNMQHHF